MKIIRHILNDYNVKVGRRGHKMEQILWITIILLIIGVGILSTHLWCYKKQIKHIEKQLEFLKEEESNYQLTSVCEVGDTVALISNINCVMEKLRKEKRELQKANRGYRESITSISHDIRTPLTSVKGYVQMLQNPTILEWKKMEYLHIVECRLEDLSEMLNQLFEYARIEAGEMALNLEKINVRNLFTETISMFYDEFVKKGCEPEIEIVETPCFILADSHAFVRILENLIKNALVHGIGDYKFLLKLVGQQIFIQISNKTDTIEEKDMEQIFDRFYTTDQSRTRKSTGLGLAIARKFTEQMGGKIQAYLYQDNFTVEVQFKME